MGEYLLVSCVHDYPKVCLLLIVEGTPPVGGRPQATCSQCLQYYPIIFGLQMTWFGLSLCPDGSLFPEFEWKLSLKLFGFPKSFCSNPVFGFAKSWSCKASALSPDLTTEQQVHTIDCSLASHKDTKLNRLIDQ